MLNGDPSFHHKRRSREVLRDRGGVEMIEFGSNSGIAESEVVCIRAEQSEKEATEVNLCCVK